MTARSNLPNAVEYRLRWPLTLTWAGMMAERITHAFWPVWTILAATAGVLMMGLQDMAPVEVVWGGLILSLAGLVIFAGLGFRKFRWPRRSEALARVDATLPGRPLTAMLDDQAIGRGDAASEALWARHKARMAQTAAEARAVEPDLKLSRKDPFGLRYIALLGLVVALLFGSVWRVGSVGDLAPGGAGLAQGPSWEGWVEPPAYTGLPSLYLADQDGVIVAPENSRITLRFYGEIGALSLAETVSGRTEDVGAASDPEQSFDLTQDGTLTINGPGGAEWSVTAVPDVAPTIALIEEGARTSFDGVMSQPFEVVDDYGVIGGTATIQLDLARVTRAYGLTREPDPRGAIELDLPMPITGGRAEFSETLVENLSKHAWAHLPVRMELRIEDETGQVGVSEVKLMPLPARRFFDPVAAAIIEMRRDLLWSRANATRVAQVIRAISHRPEDRLFRDEGDYLRLRVILRRLEAATMDGRISEEARDELAEALWDLAIELEDGDIGDALERMREAQERLSEAMRRGASDEEIAQLMQELRDATQDYLRQQMQQAQRENDTDQPDSGEAGERMELSQQDLQDMMDRIQELMEQGRMAEAEQALREFQELMENLQVTEGQQGQGGSEGQQAMEGLADTLRQQQGLSDQAFRDLQEQFNPGAQSGQSSDNEGRNGGEGRGQSHDGTGGRGGGSGVEQGDGSRPEGSDGTLAERQEALRRELERQRGNLPAGDGEAGQAARDALDRADDAMGRAEEALRDNELADAIDQQSQAMDALRDGMQNLGQALAENAGRNPGGQGQARGQDNNNGGVDPLGRNASSQTRGGPSQGDFFNGEDPYGRARDLLDEIRRRSGEGARPEVERNYLRRLLDRF